MYKNKKTNQENKHEKVENLRFPSIGRDGDPTATIIVGVLVGVVVLFVIIALLKGFLQNKKLKKRYKNKKLAGLLKCNPKLAKANNPRYKCNGHTGRWNLK